MNDFIYGIIEVLINYYFQKNKNLFLKNIPDEVDNKFIVIDVDKLK